MDPENSVTNARYFEATILKELDGHDRFVVQMILDSMRMRVDEPAQTFLQKFPKRPFGIQELWNFSYTETDHILRDKLCSLETRGMLTYLFYLKTLEVLRSLGH